MRLSTVCINRPVMATLLTAAIVLMGLVGYNSMPISALPQVDFPTIQVTANLPGASPETMASTVATPLERQLSTLSGLSSMTSTSTTGVSQIVLQFDLARNIDAAALDVQSALTVAGKKLPKEMTTPPSFAKVDPSAQPVLILVLTSPVLPLSLVDEYAETVVSPLLSTLPGVAQVLVFGSQKYAVRVRVRPSLLAARGIGLDEVQQALAAATSNTPVGVISGPDQQATLQVANQPMDAASYRPLIVAWRDGAPVRLAEVAEVIDSVENDRSAGWLNGVAGIALGVQAQPGANVVEVADGVERLLPQLKEQLPAAVDVHIVADRSASVRDSIADVRFTLLLTGALVILTIFLFLRRVTATIIPGIAMAVSIVGTFAGMAAFGFSLNNISLMGLTLAVGFVVDDAIVMLENIVRYMEKGEEPRAAALRGADEIGFTIVSMTLSLVAVFIPVLFMGGLVGRLFHEFAVTVTLAIVVSGFVSLTLTPMMGSRILRHGGEGQEGPLGRALEAGFRAMLWVYRGSLRMVLRFKALTLLATFATLAGSIYAFYAVPKGFFPTEDTGIIQGVTEGPQDISFDSMVRQQARVAAVIAADPAVANVYSAVGFSGASPINSGRMFIELKPREERDGAVAVVQRLRRELAGTPGLSVFLQPVQSLSIGGKSSKAQYQYTMGSGDLAALYEWAPKMLAQIRALPDLQDVSSDLELGSPQIVVDVDRDRAAVLGINAEQIRSTLYSAYGTRQVATIFAPTNDYEVILEADPRFGQIADNLGRLHVRAGDGRLIAFDSFAELRRTVGPLTVNHLGQSPSVTISFNLAPGAALSDAIAGVRAAEQAAGIPTSIQTGFAGTAQVFQQSLAGQGWLLLAAIATIYIILGILYESYIHPITILSGLPSAGLGAVITLIAFKLDLSIIAMIGVVMLIGIVKKNAIMMIDFAIEREREGAKDAEQAIFDAAVQRFRPIMMTTFAAVAGIMPIALGVGAGSELRQPLGIAVAGGLLLSQALTLYITPVVFLYLDRLRRRA